MPGTGTWSSTKPCVPQGANSLLILTGAKERNDQSREAFPARGRKRAGFGGGDARARGTGPPLHSPSTHLPGSGICRLPLLSTTSRGGRGCPAPTCTSRNVGVLKDTGGSGQQEPPSRHTPSDAQLRGEDGHWCLRLSQRWYNPAPELQGLKPDRWVLNVCLWPQQSAGEIGW